jgi:hypothetical protein
MPRGDWWKTKSPEELAARNKAVSDSIAARSEEEKEAIKQKRLKSLKTTLDARTPEEKAESSRMHKQTLAERTPEEQTIVAQHMSDAQLNRTPEEKEETNRRHSETINSRTEEEQQEVRKHQSEGQTNRSFEEQMVSIEKARVSRLAWWASRTPEELAKHAENISKGERRKTPEQKAETVRKYRETIANWSESDWENYSLSLRNGHANRTLEEKALTSERNSLAAKNTWASYTEEERNERVRKCWEGVTRCRTFPELLVETYLNTYYPNEWLYNGQGQASVRVNGKTPDLVHTKNKWAILVHGVFFHDPEKEIDDVKCYTDKGWRCYVIWEYDTSCEEELSKIVDFFITPV